MNEKEFNKKERQKLIIVGTFCLIAIISVIGYTYSYFTATATNTGTITGTVASASLSLNVTKVAPDTDKALVPQLDSAIASAVVGTQGNCLDDNLNAVCQVYQVTVTNTSTMTINVDGLLELNAGSNPHLKWALISSYTDGMTTKPTVTSNLNSYTETVITSYEEYTANQTKTYYIVLWISEQNIVQNDTGSFSGVVTFSISGEKILLNTMQVGDYVAYVGDSANGCLYNVEGVTGGVTIEAVSGNSCLGENANQSDYTSGSYGYCSDSSYQFTTYGWRIAYIENDNVYLTSAGSPECIFYEGYSSETSPYSFTENENNTIFINSNQLGVETLSSDLNTAALKYCNAIYADGGTCTSDNTWAMGNEDFKKMTYAISGTSSNLTSYYGSPYCYYTSSDACGLGNDLIDNGGYYWFVDTSDAYGVFWNPYGRGVDIDYGYTNAYGFRPIIRLSSSVYVTGGEGTMTSPYEIGI